MKKILNTLHEQFSINQNDTSQRFVTLFVGLFFLFASYGLAYGIAVGFVDWNAINVTPNAVLILAVILSTVLTFLIVLLIYLGYQHRRDQFINDKIRRKYLKKKKYEYFFNNYKGRDKTILSFIPDYISIHVVFLVVFKVMIFFSIMALPMISNAQDIEKIDTVEQLNGSGILIINNNIQKNNGERVVYKTVPSSKVNKDSIDISVNLKLEITPDTIHLNTVNHLERCESHVQINCWLFSIAIGLSLIGFIIIIGMLICYHKKYIKNNTETEKN